MCYLRELCAPAWYFFNGQAKEVADYVKSFGHCKAQKNMLIPGKRIRRTCLIQTEKYVVAVDVEMVIPPDDPSEPCYESETVEYLKEVKERAEKGDVAWLSQRGKVYAAVGAAS